MADPEEHGLIAHALKAFYWLDEGLQTYLRSKGWPSVSRSQSMIMINIILGIHQPSAMARNLGISRQAVFQALGEMEKMDLIEIHPNEKDKRSRHVKISASANQIQVDSKQALELMEQELIRRIGKKSVEDLKRSLARDWGPEMTFPE